MTSGTIDLREIRLEDLDLLRQHRNDPGTRVWLENDGELSAAQQLQWFRNGGGTNLRIARSAGVDVGLARLAHLAHLSHLAHDGAAHDCAVGLDIFAAFRGRGLARPVFHHICATACAAGARRLMLWVFRDNVRAMHTYLGEGFVLDDSAPVRWLVRQFAHDSAPVAHAYVKMTFTAKPRRR